MTPSARPSPPTSVRQIPIAPWRYRVAAWRQLREEVARASNQEMWRYTADLLYILQNPIIREGFFPTTEHLYSVEAARPEDGPAITEIVRPLHEPPATVVFHLQHLVATGAPGISRCPGQDGWCGGLHHPVVRSIG